MHDASLTLDKGESIKLFAYQQTAKRYPECLSVFVWLDDKEVPHVSLSDETTEDKVAIEVQHGVITKFEKR